jgi:hypothetical protein
MLTSRPLTVPAVSRLRLTSVRRTSRDGSSYSAALEAPQRHLDFIERESRPLIQEPSSQVSSSRRWGLSMLERTLCEDRRVLREVVAE